MNTPDETWQALLEGRDAITDLPEGRWEEFLDEPRIAERVAKARTRGGYLTDIKGFDAEFFALSKMEADNIDPQQRMALELTWEALEHARIPASSLRGESVGVYIGSSTNDYSFLAMSDPSIAHPYAITGTASSIIANRVSYFYDFRGPSMAIDTACSSSLVAAHQGVQALRSRRGRRGDRRRRERVDHAAGDGRLRRGRRRARAGRPDQVVLAGRRRLRPLRGRRHAGAQAASPTPGATATRSSRSSRAARSTTTAGPTACWRRTRTRRPRCCARRTRTRASIRATVDYIEAHGTGTILGDPIEADALGRVVGRGRAADKPALLGAVKSNVGHLESAAGAASLAKMALALKNDKIPPSINYTGPNPYIDFDGDAPEGRRHRHRLAALQRPRDHRCLRLRLRRRQRAPGAARGAAVGSR